MCCRILSDVSDLQELAARVDFLKNKVSKRKSETVVLSNSRDLGRIACQIEVTSGLKLFNFGSKIQYFCMISHREAKMVEKWRIWGQGVKNHTGTLQS